MLNVLQASTLDNMQNTYAIHKPSTYSIEIKFLVLAS